jgi:hypothetical protein
LRFAPNDLCGVISLHATVAAVTVLLMQAETLDSSWCMLQLAAAAVLLLLNIEFYLVHVAAFMYLVICLASGCYCDAAAAAKNRSLVNACSRIYSFRYLSC